MQTRDENEIHICIAFKANYTPISVYGTNEPATCIFISNVHEE